MKWNKIIAALFFIISAHTLFNYLGIYEKLERRPCSIHSWSQCERASIALNYYQEDMNFFKPKIHKVLDGEGITGMEFPFVNYSVAILYKLFGFHEIYYRSFVLATVLFGVFLFYMLSFSFTENYLLSLATVSAAYFSPVLIYYSINFLAEASSLGFVLAAWYFIIKYFKSSVKKHFYLFFTFALLAALVKVTSLIVFGVLIGLVILDQLKFFHSTRNNVPLIRDKRSALIYSVSGIVIVFTWYAYAGWLSKTYHSDAFLLKQTIVEDTKEALMVWGYIKNLWANEYYAPDSYLLICAVIPIMILGYKYVNRLLFSITLLSVLGTACFVFLLLFQFRNHDYYIIPLLPCVFLLLLTFGDFICRLANTFFPPLKFMTVLVLFFLGVNCIAHCKTNLNYRFDPFNYWSKSSFMIYEDLEPKLRSLGIKRTDVTLSGYDYSYCNSLYLMNQRGWTLEPETNRRGIDSLLSKDIQYLILNDTVQFNKTYPNSFKDKIIGYHRGLFIYKLK